VDTVLREQAAARPPPFVFVEGTGMPDALRLAGRYQSLADGSIAAKVRLFRDHVRVRERAVEGRADALDALAQRIAEVVAEGIREALAVKETRHP
jgi:hypothetical protein